MAQEIDWKKLNPFDSKGPSDFKPGELNPAADLTFQPKWKIPDKVCIQATISGGGAGFTKKHNPSQPANLDEIRDSAEECIKAGASVIHLDNQPEACVTRDGRKLPIGTESYMYVAKPLLEKYGREKFCPHINCLRGTYEEAMGIVVNGLAEISYINPSNSPTWIRTTVKLFQDYDIKAELVVHSSAKIDFAERLLIRTGLMPNPNLWIILPGLLLQWPHRLHDFIPNERAMCQNLMFLVERIREVDPEGFITVCGAGRATRYLTTLALLLGVHIRVGMEDTCWKYPHKDEKISNNAEDLREATEIARLLGREIMTPNEYRQAVGLKPRYDKVLEGIR
ncbi:MAG: 3-keto-5-aminohexanoate cleavage protein [Chloroflexi bacterium]|nr:3-keto-5-aminohexanoate cleavage protein [Chloroflexota bacterium]